MATEQDWWKNRLAEDIYATLRMKEQSLQVYNGRSPLLWMRPALVHWIGMLREQFNVCATAQHLAVYLLDYFQDGMVMEWSSLYLVAATCFIVAVKFEDNSRRAPRFSTIMHLIPQPPACIPSGSSISPTLSSCTLQDFISTEQVVLNYFDWELTVSVVPHFVPYFLQVAIDDDDLINGLPMTSKPLVKSYVEQHTLYFQDACLQDPCFRQIAPSLLAASCVAAARTSLHLTPTWPKQLELMTDYFLEELLPCVEQLLKFYRLHQQLRNRTLPLAANPCYMISNVSIHPAFPQSRFFPNGENSAVSYSTSLRNNDSPLSINDGPIIPWSQQS